MQHQILFVDDDQFILEGLRRVIFCSCDEWDADFASSGQEALEMFDDEPYDIVVSDMRMPGMDGNQLLQRIRSKYPDTIRLILSGQADNEDILRAFGPAHHFISKPCNAEKLKTTVNRIVDLHEYLKIQRLEDVLAGIPQLDPLVATIREFYAKIESKDLSADDLGEIVMNDEDLSAALVRFVNSPAFNLSQPASDPYHALCLLSADQVRPLALAAYIHNTTRKIFGEPAEADDIARHCMAVAGRARMIASMEATDVTAVEYAFVAALLHDLGKLIMLGAHPTEYRNMLVEAQQKGISLTEAEMQTFNATHAEVGAALLGLCELPSLVVEAILYHHCLGLSGEPQFDAAVAVHVSNVLENEECAAEDNQLGGSITMNRDYLNRLGRLEKVDSWRRSKV